MNPAVVKMSGKPLLKLILVDNCFKVLASLKYSVNMTSKKKIAVFQL